MPLACSTFSFRLFAGSFVLRFRSAQRPRCLLPEALSYFSAIRNAFFWRRALINLPIKWYMFGHTKSTRMLSGWAIHCHWQFFLAFKITRKTSNRILWVTSHLKRYDKHLKHWMLFQKRFPLPTTARNFSFFLQLLWRKPCLFWP